MGYKVSPFFMGCHRLSVVKKEALECSVFPVSKSRRRKIVLCRICANI